MAWNVLRSKSIFSPRPFTSLSESSSHRSISKPTALAAGSSLQPPPSSLQPVDEFWALKDVSFEVKQGEVVGIIGRNGAGKSTLLKILSRITEPTSGRFGIRGRVASLLEVGTGFHPELTGRENIYVSGVTLGMTRAEIRKRFDEIVGFSGVEKFLDTPVKHYSSGMQVRLGFAVAAHLPSQILIIDEVLAVGDAAFQQRCLEKIGEAAANERTVILVSHNMHSVRQLCHRAIALDGGYVISNCDVNSAIFDYQKTTGSHSCREWTANIAPGNDELKLLSISVTSGEAPITAAIYESSNDLRFTLCYQVLRPNTKARTAISFHAEGVCAFTLIEPRETNYEDAGKYELSVKLPSNILANKVYSVGVSVFRSSGAKEHYLRSGNILAINVCDSKHNTRVRGDYSQNLEGLVLPAADWEIPVLSRHC